MDKHNKVLIKKADNYDLAKVTALIEEIFSELPAAARLSDESRVVIKPNLLAKHAPEAAVTTHPVVVEATINVLQSRGVKQIAVIDSAGGIYNEKVMMGIYRASGLAEVCERLGVRYGEDYESVAVKTEGVCCREFTILKPITEADFIINLPKLKTHAMVNLTCATKNLFGCIPGLLKAELHMRFPEKEIFGEMLCDVAELVNPDISIVDAITAMEGDGPAGGKPRATGMLIAGESTYDIDVVCAKYIGAEIEDIPYLIAAKKRGLCRDFSDDLLQNPSDFEVAEDYELPGSHLQITFENRVPKILKPFMPQIVKLVAPRPVINKRACIGCAKCAEICPKDVITMDNRKAFIHKKDCIRCFCCHEMCPVKAIDIKRVKLFNG